MQLFDFQQSNKINNIHMIGIGGSSMSGLAEILVNLGYKVSGSDLKISKSTQRLEKLGVKVYPYHSEDNILDPDLIVYTVAVKDNNPELIKGRSLNIPVIDRAELLGAIMRKYPYSIAVSGTHGKTTTTSMITMIMLEAGLDPNIHIGGELGAIGGNTKIGGSRYFITEACEYYGSFLKFNPYLAVILNIEADHLDYFKDLAHIKSTFESFVSLIPDNGYIVACADDPDTVDVMDAAKCNKITYGLKSENAIWGAKDISFDEMGCASFTLTRHNQSQGMVKLNVPGIHNVSNSLAAIASCDALGCSMTQIIQGLYNFTGTNRRFELKGVVDDIKVIDDYAHHPSEVKATLRAAKNCVHKKIWCVFQPHTYTRTKLLLDDFSVAFSDADTVILADIFAAREADNGQIHSSMLADKIKSQGKDVLYLSGFDAIVDYLKKNVSPGDLIMTLGAGDIYKVGELFIESTKIMAVS